MFGFPWESENIGFSVENLMVPTVRRVRASRRVSARRLLLFLLTFPSKGKSMWQWHYAGRFVLCAFTLCSVGFAQQRDPSAIAILNQAAAAMGSTSVLAEFGSSECTGSIQAVEGSNTPSGTFVWKHQFSASGYQFRSEFTNNGLTQILVSGPSGPAVSNNGTVRSLPAQVTLAIYPIHLPAVVIGVFLANPNYSVTTGSPVQLGNVLANHISVSIGTDDVSMAQTPQDWYFDPNTGLPLRVEYRVADGSDALQFTTASADFSNYQAVTGILVPLAISNSESGAAVTTATLDPVQWNYPVGGSDFTLP